MSSPPLLLLLDLHQTNLPLSGKIDFLPPLLLLSSFFLLRFHLWLVQVQFCETHREKRIVSPWQVVHPFSYPPPTAASLAGISSQPGRPAVSSLPYFSILICLILSFLNLLLILHLFLFLLLSHQSSHLLPPTKPQTPLPLSEPSLGSMLH